MRLGIVTSWYGPDLMGGAERQARQVALRLAERDHDVEILTTCCRSFLDDWSENHLKPGEHRDGKVLVRRFPVDGRDRRAFDAVNARLLTIPGEALRPGVPPVPEADSACFVRENINSGALLHYLGTRGREYDAVLFIPYLYGPILNGLPLVADRAWLQPCLHDEAYAYLPAVERLFRLARGLLFNSQGEADLAARLYGPCAAAKGVVVGEGVEETMAGASARVGGLDTARERYVLCLGRRDQTKNTDLLVEAYDRFRRERPDAGLRLVLAGPGEGRYEGPKGLLDLGLVSEQDKAALLAGCLALFQPSRNESYSRVIMEAWLAGRPVAAHRDCLATAVAVREAGGGFLARGEEEWAALLARIEDADRGELDRLGLSGQAYARRYACWNRVMERYEAVLAKPLSPRPKHVGRRAVHQLLPNLAYGDAISNHALALRNHLRALGLKSEIFVSFLDERLEEQAQTFRPGLIGKKDGLIYHHSIGSELTPHAVRHPGPKLLIYHNITPARFFEPYRPGHARLLAEGREALRSLAASFGLSGGVSAYNTGELAESGFPESHVLPITIDPLSLQSGPPDAGLMDWLQDGRTNILFVGRVAPNKGQDDLVRFFAEYLRLDPEARLLIVGGCDEGDPYLRHLQSVIAETGTGESVYLTGPADGAELQAYYRASHVYLSMSEHEGFGVPLIEAMWFDLPVVAFKSSAVPETLGQAALMFDSKDDLGEIAGLVRCVVAHPELRENIIAAQRRRRRDFLPEAVWPLYEEIIRRLAE